MYMWQKIEFTPYPYVMGFLFSPWFSYNITYNPFVMCGFIKHILKKKNMNIYVPYVMGDLITQTLKKKTWMFMLWLNSTILPKILVCEEKCTKTEQKKLW